MRMKELLQSADQKRETSEWYAPKKGSGSDKTKMKMLAPAAVDTEEDAVASLDKKKKKDDDEEEQSDHVVVATVDDYQGEENKIVLLTLVRSNPEEKLGFVGIENRIIVALSRAQHGMYIMGNAEMMCKGSPLWARVVQQMDSKGCYGSALPLEEACASAV